MVWPDSSLAEQRGGWRRAPRGDAPGRGVEGTAPSAGVAGVLLPGDRPTAPSLLTLGACTVLSPFFRTSALRKGAAEGASQTCSRNLWFWNADCCCFFFFFLLKSSIEALGLQGSLSPFFETGIIC